MSKEWVPSINALFPAVNGRPFVCYNDVIKHLNPTPNLGIILVAHSYETVFALSSSVAQLGNLRGVILKHSTALRFPAVKDKLVKSGIPVLELSKKEMCTNTEQVIQKISEVVPKHEQFVLMDHGGYFAYDINFFKAFPANRLIGISEHTLNGEDRYKALGLKDRPIVSIAKSNVKIPSDRSAADAIYAASNNFLINGGLELKSDFLKVGIIGYGRLGSRLGENLAPKEILINDIKRPESNAQQHFTDKETLCRKSDVIFCATGNYALQPKHYGYLKNHTVILTVTSPDDELHLEELICKGILQPVSEKSRGEAFVYRVTETGNEIILPFNGESANTSLTYGIANPTVHQAHAAHIAATICVMDKNRFNLVNGVQQLDSDMESVVCKLWKKHFSDEAQLPEVAYDPHATISRHDKLNFGAHRTAKNLG